MGFVRNGKMVLFSFDATTTADFGDDIVLEDFTSPSAIVSYKPNDAIMRDSALIGSAMTEHAGNTAKIQVIYDTTNKVIKLRRTSGIVGTGIRLMGTAMWFAN